MKYQIDQSGKIEDTSKDTVLAISNGNKHSIILSKKDKRSLQIYFRKIGKPEMFIYRSFAILLAILLHEIKPKKKVTIDNEYPGKENLIIVLLNENFQKKGWKIDIDLCFGSVGKLSSAHNLAYKTLTNKIKANYKVRLEEVKSFLKNKK